MNKLLTTLLVLLTNICIAQPRIQFKSTVFNFDTLSGNRLNELRPEFFFYNKGNQPLIINECRCSFDLCLPSWPKTEINPGDSGKITLHCSGRGYPGIFEKECILNSNATNNSQRVRIVGYILPSK